MGCYYCNGVIKPKRLRKVKDHKYPTCCEACKNALAREIDQLITDDIRRSPRQSFREERRAKCKTGMQLVTGG